MIWNLLEKSVQDYSEDVAISYDGKTLKYNDLYSSMKEVANQLFINGVNKGDNIAIFMDNSIEFIEAFFAINYCGSVILPVYPNCSFNKLLDLINFYNIKYIITIRKFLDRFDLIELEQKCKLKKLLYLENKRIYCGYSQDIYHTSENLYPYEEEVQDLALILFSSGTTSIPKGIMLSNENIESNVKGISDYLKLQQHDRILLIKNINHASSITGEMLVSIANGCTLTMTSKIFTPLLVLELLEMKSITVFFAIPSILISITKHRSFGKYKLEALRVINFYGSPIGYDSVKSIAEKFYNTELIYSYGLTEASPRVTYINKNDLLKRKTSCGKPIASVKVHILSETGIHLKPYEIGEVVVQGPNTMLGYYKNRELTDYTLRNGVLNTGDLGYVDEEGFLYITGRKDNLIIQAGKNVYPEEIEGAISSFKGIRDVLVRGEEDPLIGQKIVGYVVCEDDCKINIKNLIYYLKQNLEDYKIPREIIIKEKLEKTLSGKIIRNQVIENEH